MFFVQSIANLFNLKDILLKFTCSCWRPSNVCVDVHLMFQLTKFPSNIPIYVLITFLLTFFRLSCRRPLLLEVSWSQKEILNLLINHGDKMIFPIQQNSSDCSMDPQVFITCHQLTVTVPTEFTSGKLSIVTNQGTVEECADLVSAILGDFFDLILAKKVEQNWKKSFFTFLTVKCTHLGLNLRGEILGIYFSSWVIKYISRK